VPFLQSIMMQPDEKARDLIGHIQHQIAKGWGRYLVAKYVHSARASKSVNSLHWLLGITEDATIEAAILALSRIVVSHKSSISVEYLLDYLEQNPSAFSHVGTDALRKQVATDRKDLAAIAKTIENIKEQRDRTIAHLDKLHVNDPEAVYSHPPLQYQELDQVFMLLLRIVNHYTGLMRPSEEFTLAQMESGITGDIDYLTKLIQEDDARP